MIFKIQCGQALIKLSDLLCDIKLYKKYYCVEILLTYMIFCFEAHIRDVVNRTLKLNADYETINKLHYIKLKQY